MLNFDQTPKIENHFYQTMTHNRVLPIRGVDGRDRNKIVYGHEVQPGTLIWDKSQDGLVLYRWASIQGGVKRGYKVDPRFTVSNWDNGSKSPVQVKRIALVPYREVPGLYREGRDLYWVHEGRLFAAKNYLVKGQL